MNNNYKKYIAFLLYICLVSIPILYWINSSWGISVLFRKQVFFNLLASDFSFGLTIVSAIGALTVGIAGIIMKHSHQVQTERDIYNDNNTVRKSASEDFISTTEILTPPPVAEFEPVPKDFQIDKKQESSDTDVPVRPSVALAQQRSFDAPKAPPPAFDVSKMEMNFIVPPPQQKANANKNQSQNQPAKAFVNIEESSEIHIEKEPIITQSLPENKIEQIEISSTKFFENILKEKGYKTFDVKSIDGFDVKFFAVSNKNILFGYNMPFTGEIIANETMPEESDLNHPCWFSQVTRFMSPIFAVKKIRQSIDDLMLEVLPKNHDITIESYCILNDDSRILNMADMQESWDKDIINVVMNSKQFENIPTFDSAIEDQTTNEIMPSFLEFAETMSKYFVQKARIASLKKHT